MTIFDRNHFSAQATATPSRVLEVLYVFRAYAREKNQVKPMAVPQTPVQTVERKSIERRHGVLVPAGPGFKRDISPGCFSLGLQASSRIGEIEKGIHLGGFIDPISKEGLPDHILEFFV